MWDLVNIFKRCDFDHPIARRSECSNPNSDDFMLFGMQKWAYGPIFMKIGEKMMEWFSCFQKSPFWEHCVGVNSVFLDF